MNEKRLVIGSSGPTGAAITQALKTRYAPASVITADNRPGADLQLDIRDKITLRAELLKHQVTQVYHCPASERFTLRHWEFRLQGLLNILEVAKTDQLRVFWPGTVVFGPPRTVEDICQVAADWWSVYYRDQYGVDVRSLYYNDEIDDETIQATLDLMEKLAGPSVRR